MVKRSSLTRREALRLTSGIVGTVAATGLVAGERGGRDDRERVNVGYSRPSGRRAARREAKEEHYAFAFDALTIEVAPEAKRGLRRRDDIRYVETDAEMETLAQTLPWGVDRVDAEAAHDGGATGDGGHVAIVDTGIDEGHPDLAANLGEGVAFLGGVQSNQWNDDNGHGTHCAGIAAAVDNAAGVVGVAPAATLHAVKVMNATGTGLTSDIARGIEWTADRGYDVANLSLGSSSGASVLADACEYANDAGVLLAAAAGNSGQCTDCVSYPAAYPECVAVSATDRDDQLASFSSQGPEVELAAPGAEIYSTYLAGTYETLSGTSMASPHVAGAAGTVMADGATNTETRDRLAETAEDVGLGANESGAGLLDVENAALGTTDGDDLDAATAGGGLGLL